MKKISFLIALLLLFSNAMFAQVAVNTDGSIPDPSAGLDVKFNNKGFLPPRMTQIQRDAIQNPAEGLMVICADCGLNNPAVISIYINGAWRLLTCYCITPSAPVAATHIASFTLIIWNWNTVLGAVGYKWNTTNNFSTATDIGAATTTTETGLTCATEYTRYIWAYNTCGISTATTLTQSTLSCLTCGQSFPDVRDGKTYNTVLIGTQCWIAQNMNIGTMIPGSSGQTNHNAIEKYCYNDDETNCTVYGGLYQWDNMMQWSTSPGAQGICPDGWHSPTDAEWTTLTTFLGGENIAGGKMKEAGYAHWASPNQGATNSSGFTALPGGSLVGGFNGLTFSAFFWSSSQGGPGVPAAWYRNLSFLYEFVFSNLTAGSKLNGYSARCLKN